jgi:hypothetical protein
VLRCWSDSKIYSKGVKRQLKEPKGMAPKDLRKFLPTAAIQGGWYNAVIMERYIGHAAKTVTEGHYLADTLESLLEAYRKAVIEPLEGEISKSRADTGKVLKVV